MKFYGKAEESASRVVSAFKSGELPKALAPIFIKRSDSACHCRAWSWSNQLITALHGYSDRAIDQIGMALEKGYRDACWLQMNPDIASLQEEKRFRELLDLYFGL